MRLRASTCVYAASTLYLNLDVKKPQAKSCGFFICSSKQPQAKPVRENKSGSDDVEIKDLL